MPYKDKARQREWQRLNHQANLQTWGERRRATRKRNRELLWYLKSNTICVCGELDFRCFDFHHLSGKDTNLSTAAKNWSTDRVLSEVTKCTIICANCHHKIHSKPPFSDDLARRRNREWLDAEKHRRGCKKCGESDHRCLHFHHISNKRFMLSDAVRLGYSLALILEELGRCVCLCANCHRKDHTTRRDRTTVVHLTLDQEMKVRLLLPVLPDPLRWETERFG